MQLQVKLDGGPIKHTLCDAWSAVYWVTCSISRLQQHLAHISKHTATQCFEDSIDSPVALLLYHMLDMLCEIKSSQQVLMQASDNKRFV